MTRRKFLVSTTGAAALASAATPEMGEVKPALYSVTYIGLWYRGDALSMEQVLERAKRFGYEGVEIEGKRPHGFALDWPTKRCQEFRTALTTSGSR
jgi:sugar phosphate isomerase/epimerase